MWETFEIDDILTRHGKPRVWTDEKYWFKEHFIWNLYIERISLEYRKKLARDPQYHDTMTTLIEFARGGENGIEEALGYLHEDILKRARLIYIRVSRTKNPCARTTAGHGRGRRIRSCIIRCRTRRWSSTTRRMIGTSSKRAIRSTSR